jgi:hypothetical protein
MGHQIKRHSVKSNSLIGIHAETPLPLRERVGVRGMEKWKVFGCAGFTAL